MPKIRQIKHTEKHEIRQTTRVINHPNTGQAMHMLTEIGPRTSVSELIMWIWSRERWLDFYTVGYQILIAQK